MIFSSILFIFYFLTTLLLIYFITPKKYKNLVLLIFSLLFYFLGEPKNIIFLILSCIINYYLSYFIIKYQKKKKLKKTLLILGLSYNIITLIYFKYTNFLLNNLNNIFNLNLKVINILLPIGISFYTFQAISYLIDVYNNKHDKATNLIEFATYLTLFPQLIAGPIVRFVDIKDDLNKKHITKEDFSLGIKRFIIGLAKKILLANTLGEFILKLTTKTILSSWLKPISYTLQIYFDFSGYSDMAIGIGLMLGFHFKENFNYPFIADSITNFWRRWHISLSSWFRDYIYIPLGGNRVNKFKWILNILIVWSLTGLWHGASWNFLIWGVYFGIILIIEKLFLKKYLEKTKVLKYIYTILIVIISFLIFSNENLDTLITEFKNMFFLNNIPFTDNVTNFYLKDYFMLLVIGVISSTPLLKTITTKYKIKIFSILEIPILLIIFLISIAFLIDASFNPFLYFRF